MTKNGFFNLAALAVFLLPFSAVSGPTFFGEFKSEASFYIFFPLVLLLLPSILKDIPRLPSLFKWMVLAMTLVFIIGFLVNLNSILTAEMLDRSGLNKFLSSLGVFYFCVTVMILTFILARQNDVFYHRYFLRAMLASLIVVLVVSAIELIGWRLDGALAIYDKISELLRPLRYPDYAHDRLQSICLEPPFLAFFMGFCLIWLTAIGRESVWQRHQAWLRILLLLSLAVFVLADSRTGYVFVAGIFLVHFFFPSIIRRPAFLKLVTGNFSVFLFAVAIVGFGLLLASHHETLVNQILGGESISNLSRYASNLAAFNIFTEHPIWGAGFGQYAFHAQNTMPGWGWYSYEINDWFYDPDSTWPPVFSLPARLGAETGLLGLCVWYGSLLRITQNLLKRMGAVQLQTGNYPAHGHALLLGMVYVLLSGVAYDSFRNFGVWLILGLVAAYLSQKTDTSRA